MKTRLLSSLLAISFIGTILAASCLSQAQMVESAFNNLKRFERVAGPQIAYLKAADPVHLERADGEKHKLVPFTGEKNQSATAHFLFLRPDDNLLDPGLVAALRKSGAPAGVFSFANPGTPIVFYDTETRWFMKNASIRLIQFAFIAEHASDENHKMDNAKVGGAAKSIEMAELVRSCLKTAGGKSYNSYLMKLVGLRSRGETKPFLYSPELDPVFHATQQEEIGWLMHWINLDADFTGAEIQFKDPSARKAAKEKLLKLANQ